MEVIPSVKEIPSRPIDGRLFLDHRLCWFRVTVVEPTCCVLRFSSTVLRGRPLEFGGGITSVTIPNVFQSNGVIHVVDSILMLN